MENVPALTAANQAMDAAQLALSSAYAIEGTGSWPVIASALRARSTAWTVLATALGAGGRFRHVFRAVMMAATADGELASTYQRWVDAPDYFNGEGV